MEHKPLSLTQAGKLVNDDIDKAQLAHAAKIKELRLEERMKLDEKDREYAELLREERQELEGNFRSFNETKPYSPSPLKVLVHGFGVLVLLL